MYKYNIVPVQRGDDLHLPDVASQFDLLQTLDCGQSFRYAKSEENSLEGIAMGRWIKLSQKGNDIVMHNVTLAEYYAVWEHYFDLKTDYDKLKQDFSNDSTLKEAIAYAPGIRLLRQDPWETICTFIISANNNIPRIKGIVERLCELCGDKLPQGGYTFPTAQAMSQLSADDLAPIRSGYRASYLADAACKVASGEVDLAAVANLPTDEAMKELLKIKGVGPKVAHCILLFSFGRYECFPMDTWMKKVMSVLYPQGLCESFIPVAGIAQQYLFHYARNHAELFTEESN